MVELITKKLPSNNQQEEPLPPQYYLNILVFSKDRPFQLGQFLESFNIHCNCDKLQVDLKILYTYSNEKHFKPHYDQLKQ